MTRKEDNGRRVTDSDLDIDFRVIVIKTISYWNENRSVDQRNEIKDSSIHADNIGQLMFTKDINNMLEER